jgi:hypothetical protein
VTREQGVEVTDSASEAEGFTSEAEGFTATSDDGDHETDYLLVAGANRELAERFGCEFDGDVCDVDVTVETSVDNAYATGAMVRAEEWQAAISAGDGASAAPKSSRESAASTSTSSTCRPTRGQPSATTERPVTVRRSRPNRRS